MCFPSMFGLGWQGARRPSPSAWKLGHGPGRSRVSHACSGASSCLQASLPRLLRQALSAARVVGLISSASRRNGFPASLLSFSDMRNRQPCRFCQIARWQKSFCQKQRSARYQWTRRCRSRSRPRTRPWLWAEHVTLGKPLLILQLTVASRVDRLPTARKHQGQRERRPAANMASLLYQTDRDARCREPVRNHLARQQLRFDKWPAALNYNHSATARQQLR